MKKRYTIVLADCFAQVTDVDISDGWVIEKMSAIPSIIDGNGGTRVALLCSKDDRPKFPPARRVVPPATSEPPEGD